MSVVQVVVVALTTTAPAPAPPGAPTTRSDDATTPSSASETDDLIFFSSPAPTVATPYDAATAAGPTSLSALIWPHLPASCCFQRVTLESPELTARTFPVTDHETRHT